MDPINKKPHSMLAYIPAPAGSVMGTKNHTTAMAPCWLLRWRRLSGCDAPGRLRVSVRKHVHQVHQEEWGVKVI